MLKFSRKEKKWKEGEKKGRKGMGKKKGEKGKGTEWVGILGKKKKVYKKK